MKGGKVVCLGATEGKVFVLTGGAGCGIIRVDEEVDEIHTIHAKIDPPGRSSSLGGHFVL